LNWESGRCETGGLWGKEKRKKEKEKNGIQLATILRRRIFTRMNCEMGGFHLV